jgi:hypothetical protein
MDWSAGRCREIEAGGLRQSIIDVQADQAIATTFFDKTLRSRKVATGPINLINNADFLPSPVRGCRPCFERY